MERLDKESYISYAKRLTALASDGLITYQEWSDSLIDNIPYESEGLRRCENWFSQFIKKLDDIEFEEEDDDSKRISLLQLKDQIERERIKFSQEKTEYRQKQRQEARNDLFEDRLAYAISGLKPIEVNPCELTEKVGTSAVLVVSDLHYDSNYTLEGVYGEIVNQYNKEICKGRMSRLISLIDADDIVVDDLTVVFNGDLIEGVLRASSLIKLTQPVVDSVIELSEFLSQWIVALQNKIRIPVTVAIVGGNHSVLRPLMSKPIDERENLEKIIHKFIELRLENQPNIIVKPYGDAYFTTLRGNNILFLHGEDNNLETTMTYYEDYYNVNLDYCVAGHYHRGESKTIGVGSVANKEVIRVPSICGVDGYAKKLKKNARAGATLMLFTENGRDWSKNYCLN